MPLRALGGYCILIEDSADAPLDFGGRSRAYTRQGGASAGRVTQLYVGAAVAGCRGLVEDAPDRCLGRGLVGLWTGDWLTDSSQGLVAKPGHD